MLCATRWVSLLPVMHALLPYVLVEVHPLSGECNVHFKLCLSSACPCPFSIYLPDLHGGKIVHANAMVAVRKHVQMFPSNTVQKLEKEMNLLQQVAGREVKGCLYLQCAAVNAHTLRVSVEIRVLTAAIHSGIAFTVMGALLRSTTNFRLCESINLASI